MEGTNLSIRTNPMIDEVEGNHHRGLPGTSITEEGASAPTPRGHQMEDEKRARHHLSTPPS
jgi:hypothetical protein